MVIHTDLESVDAAMDQERTAVHGVDWLALGRFYGQQFLKLSLAVCGWRASGRRWKQRVNMLKVASMGFTLMLFSQ